MLLCSVAAARLNDEVVFGEPWPVYYKKQLQCCV